MNRNNSKYSIRTKSKYGEDNKWRCSYYDGKPTNKPKCEACNYADGSALPPHFMSNERFR